MAERLKVIADSCKRIGSILSQSNAQNNVVMAVLSFEVLCGHFGHVMQERGLIVSDNGLVENFDAFYNLMNAGDYVAAMDAAYFLGEFVDSVGSQCEKMKGGE